MNGFGFGIGSNLMMRRRIAAARAAAFDSGLIANGDFADASVWVITSGWAISSGFATATGGGYLYQSCASWGGAGSYRVSFKIITRVSGDLLVRIGGDAATVITASAPGVYNQDVTWNGVGGNFNLYGDFIGSIDKIRVVNI